MVVLVVLGESHFGDGVGLIPEVFCVVVVVGRGEHTLQLLVEFGTVQNFVVILDILQKHELLLNLLTFVFLQDLL